MIYSREIEAQIIAQAKQAYPEEACGFIVDTPKGLIVAPVPNSSPRDRRDFFRIDHKDRLRVEKKGTLVAVYHSHPNGSPTPSDMDKAVSRAIGLPAVIVSYPSKQFFMHHPSAKGNPYVGRQYLLGTQDCFILLKDWYKQELNITIPFNSYHDGWMENGRSRYLVFAEKAGFKQITLDQVQRHDVMLFCMESATEPEHAVVYLGGNRILHHLDKQLSNESIYGSFWRNRTHSCWRHKDLLK